MPHVEKLETRNSKLFLRVPHICPPLADVGVFKLADSSQPVAQTFSSAIHYQAQDILIPRSAEGGAAALRRDEKSVCFAILAKCRVFLCILCGDEPYRAAWNLLLT